MIENLDELLPSTDEKIVRSTTSVDLKKPLLNSPLNFKNLEGKYEQMEIELEKGENSKPEIRKPFRLRFGRPTRATVLRIILLVILLTAISIFLGLLFGSDKIQDSLVDGLSDISSLPKWASSLIVTAMYAGGLLIFCPGTPFNLAAGFLFGMGLGTGVAMGGCVLGALVAFLLGRTIFREWVKKKMEKKPKFKAVDWAIEQKGLYIVFLTRLSPLFPFPLLNYAFGITKVPVWKYFLGTIVGVAPGTIGYTYLGTLMRNLTDMWNFNSGNSDEEKTTKNIIYMSVGSIMTILSIIIISIITKRAISKATKEYELRQQQSDPMLPKPMVELEEIKLDSSESSDLPTSPSTPTENETTKENST